MVTRNVIDKVYWVFIALVCFIRGVLIIPNVDDGIYFYQIYNTVGWHNPFYNDYYGQYFHFMKPLTVLYALLYSLAGNTSFRIIALLHSAELFACACAFYACARRYACEEASRAGTLLFLYFLFVQFYLSPTRPETTVLLCALTVFWLCERFSDTRGAGYVCGAIALTFLVAIPMHTNGSIPFIYLLLFMAVHRQQLSRGLAVKCGICLLLCAPAGAAILLYPGLSSFAHSLALFSYDGSRFSMLKGEYVRMRQFVGYHYNFPLMCFLVAFSGGILLSGYRGLRRADLQKYRSLFLFLLAVVLGLGVLPSATWEVYAVYYLLPLMAGCAVAFDHSVRRISHRSGYRFLLAAVGLVTLWYGYGTMPGLYLLLYALPLFLAAVLLKRIALLHTLAVMVIPMFLFCMVQMGSSKSIYDRAQHEIGEAGELVLAHPLFNFSGRKVAQVGAYQIIGMGGDHVIALGSIARAKAGLINAHPLVKWFGVPARTGSHQSAWVFRRRMGREFLLISNNEWKVPALIESQVRPLGYSIIREIPLSDPLLDRYANPSMKALKCIEYRYTGPTT